MCAVSFRILFYDLFFFLLQGNILTKHYCFVEGRRKKTVNLKQFYGKCIVINLNVLMILVSFQVVIINNLQFLARLADSNYLHE